MAGAQDAEARRAPRENMIDAIVRDLNERFAVAVVGGRTVVLDLKYVNPEFQESELRLLSQGDFFSFYANDLQELPCADGEVERVQRMRVWWNHPLRRSYRTVAFLPGAAAQVPDDVYNLWRGWAVVAQPGDCTRRRQYILDVIAARDPDKRDYVLNWLASMVQRPAETARTALVMSGPEGVGKSTLGDICSQFLGSSYKVLTQSRHLTGNFNAHLRNVVCAFADEAFWAGDRSQEGALKGLITSPEIQIEHKGKDVMRTKNHVHVLMATNNDWVVPAGLTARRFVMLLVSDAKRNDEAYFGAIRAEMAAHPGAFLHFLLQRDLSRFKPAELPESCASFLWENKLYTMDPLQKFWYNLLDEQSALMFLGKAKTVDDPLVVSKNEVYARYQDASRGAYRVLDLGLFFKSLRKLLPKPVKDCRPEGVMSLELPSIRECRKHFAKQCHTDEALIWSDQPEQDEFQF